MRGNEKRTKTLSIIIGLLCLFILYRLGADALASIFQRSEDPSRAAISAKVAPGNQAGYFSLARIEHYGANPDSARAIGLYRKALALNPFNSRLWYELALAYEASGDRKGALHSIKNAYLLNPMQAENIWDTGVFYMNAAGLDSAAYYFRKYMQLGLPVERSFDALHSMQIPVEYITEKFLSGNRKVVSEYAGYLARRKKADEGVRFWQAAQKDLIGEKEKLRLCNMFLDHGKYEEAWSVWGHMEREPSILSDGGFERDSKGACFDWIIKKSEGVQVSRDSGSKTEGSVSLKVAFPDKNVKIYAVQHVLLRPGAEYVLSADLKTEGITSTNGVYMEVSGLRCASFRRSSGVYTGTNAWTRIELPFHMPSECRAARISFRRELSSKFNNRIGGAAWLDNVELGEATE